MDFLLLIFGIPFVLLFFYFALTFIINKILHRSPRFDPNKVKNKGNIFYLSYGSVMACEIFPHENFVIDENTKFLIFSHGNSSTIGSHIDKLIEFSRALNIVVIEYDYLGYGKNVGNFSPSEQGCYESLEIVMNYLLDYLKISPKNIYLMGRSLGTGVVIDYVSKNGWLNPIILVAPYKSIISTKFNWLIFDFVDQFCSIKKMNNVKCPAKIFHGEKDKTVPISHGKAIYAALENKAFEPKWIADAEHCNIFDFINYNDYKEVFEYKIL